jgi:hypothetical protein
MSLWTQGIIQAHNLSTLILEIRFNARYVHTFLPLNLE